MTRKLFLFILLLGLFKHTSYSQKRIAIYSISTISSKSGHLFSIDSDYNGLFRAIPAYCVDYFSNNVDFVTIDRKNFQLIENEREIQKSESFMDGYVVGQGKSEGVDLICQSVFDVDTYSLIIKILDVKAEKVLCSSDKKMDKNLFGIKDLKQQVTAMLLEISSKCFENEIPVVRVLEAKGKKAKKVLIAAGSNLRLRSGYKIEIYELVNEKIGNKTITRKNTVSSGEISKVEDENFSVLEIFEGNEKLLELLNTNTPLFCKPTTN